MTIQSVKFSALQTSIPMPEQKWLWGLIPIERPVPYTVLPSYIKGERPLYATEENKAQVDAVTFNDPSFDLAYLRTQKDAHDWFQKRGLYHERPEEPFEKKNAIKKKWWCLW